MSIIHVNHIQSNCRARFSSLIDISDIKTTNPDERDNFFLTRSLAAFAMSAIAKIDDTAAAQSVVDEYHDDGIDAFFYDRVEHVIYLLQSKWVKNGSGSIDLGSMLKFLQGVNHFIEGKLTLLGPKLQAKSQHIKDALDDTNATFALITACTGKPSLSVEVRQPLDQLVNEYNDDGALVAARELRQKELHDIVAQRALGDSVDLEVLLQEWGTLREPYRVYYGQMNTADIIQWAKYGDHLYHKNIRGFKGSTEVNDSISLTLKDAPDNFFYFNNGITLLCSELDKKPLGGKSRTSGVFACRGASVINGAQTVGSIISALSAPSASTTARVMVRLISLKDCPPDFGVAVTKAANTQNRIEKRDFAALDEEQGRIRSEMLLSLGKEYVFKSGDREPSPDAGCTLDDAAVALACAHSDITYCMTAKREVSRLYEDIKAPPYTVLFNPSLTALKIWRAVEVMRKVDAFIKEAQANKEGKERGIVIHGNRVLLHLVFKELPDSIFAADSADDEMAKVPGFSDKCLNSLTTEIIANYSSSYPAQLFKNITKCKAIVKAIAHTEETLQGTLKW